MYVAGDHLWETVKYESDSNIVFEWLVFMCLVTPAVEGKTKFAEQLTLIIK